MPTPLDHEFVRAVARAADRPAAPLAAGPDEEPAGVTHRALARRVRTLVAAYRSPDSALHGSSQAVAASMTHVRALRAAQTATGLFAGGDNVQSPPDSAFTVNDVCDAHVIAAGAGPELRDVTAALAEIAGAAYRQSPDRWGAHPEPPLGAVRGAGPAAPVVPRRPAARTASRSGSPKASTSTRRACTRNAAPTTRPMCPTLRCCCWPTSSAAPTCWTPSNATSPPPWTSSGRTARWRPSTRGGRTSTTRSRWRPTCRTTGCSRSVPAGATSAGRRGWRPPAASTTPTCSPRPSSPRTCAARCRNRPRRHFHATGTSTTARLAARASTTAHTVVYGGSDVPGHRRIRSGLACNPTFLRLFAGDAVLDTVRLSRGFFDLGPFRAAGMQRLADSRYRLTETLTAAYYQPLPPDRRQRRRRLPAGGRGTLLGRDGLPGPASGRGLTDDPRRGGPPGRRCRPADRHQRTTGALGPRTDLPAGRRPGGAVPIGDARWCRRRTDDLPRRRGRDPVEAGVEAGEPLAGPDRSDVLRYDPGEEYTVVGGTDASATPVESCRARRPRVLRRRTDF